MKPSASPSKKTGVEGVEDRENTRGVNQTQAGSKPAGDGRRPSRDAAASGGESSISSQSRGTSGNAKPPSKQPSAAVESKAFAPSPPLPSRTRQLSPTPQRNTAEAPVRALEPRSEESANKTKALPAPAVVGSEAPSSRIDDRRLLSKDTGPHTAAGRDSTPTRLTDTKRSGTSLLMHRITSCVGMLTIV